MGIIYTPQTLAFPPPRTIPSEECEPWETAYIEAKVDHVVDADTFDLGLNLGHNHRDFLVRIRLCGEDWLRSNRKIGFNAWETRGVERPRGEAAEARVLELMHVGSRVRTRSFKGGTRGSLYRWLHLVLVPCELVGETLVSGYRSESPAWYSIADILLHEGHGRHWWRGWKRGAPMPTVST